MNTPTTQSGIASSTSLAPNAEAWIVRCRPERLSSEDLARIADHAKVARSEPWVWIQLQCNENADTRDNVLTQTAKLAASLPGDRWRLLGKDLVRPGMRVPDQELPDLPWQAVEAVVRFELPRIEVAARVPQEQRISLRLIRGGNVSPCEGLLTNGSALARWIQSAPESRLRALRWVIASSSPNRCVILGKQLPPVTGVPLVNRQQILLPAGFCWEPNVAAPDVRQVFNLSANQWMLWENDQTSSTIQDDSFAVMNRASVRQWIAMQDDTTDDTTTQS
ncbi:MAG TPA: hypothetical protein DDZ51_07400 [Planctomycetaceae bacterium]|nr:hypothetical protein [Planctomycetaceae bacterium]